MSAPAVPSLVKTITQQQIARYADAANDHNPIHVDADFARNTPPGGTIAHGMLVLAAIGEMMAAAFGERWISAGKLRVRFRAPARPGDEISASATAQSPRDGSWVYGVECKNQRGELLISGTAEVPGGE